MTNKAYICQNAMQLNWRVTANEIEQARIERTEQCPILHYNSKQKSLWILYAIEKKSNAEGLVLYLVDKYSRDRIAHKGKARVDLTDLSIADWVQTSHLVHSLTNNDKYKSNIISAAVKTFFARFNSKIMFNTIQKTKDLAEPFAKYIHDITCFINKLCLKCDKTVVPFQIDVWIKAAQQTHCADNESSEEEDDEKEDHKINNDNIIDRLESNKMIYAQNEMNEKNQNTERLIQTLFEQLMESHKKDGMHLAEFMRGNRFVLIVERRDSDSDYVMVADLLQDDKYVVVSHDDDKGAAARRTSVNDTQFGDVLYLFMPQKGNKIPGTYSAEILIQLSCDCVLPAMVSDEDKCSQITAQTAANDFFMLSFHVKQTDEISCYQYQRGQMSRFMPSDIANLWPFLFDSRGGRNDKFFEHEKEEKNDSYVAKTRMIDNKFMNFCKIGWREHDKE